jgi:hypothetical protein
MTPRPPAAASPDYSHELLLHDDEWSLIEGTRAFVSRGLISGGQVLVHGDEQRLELMRSVLEPHPNLHFVLERVLYQNPAGTLFAQQRALAESDKPLQLWSTGSLPGSDMASFAAWARYESLVNEALEQFDFHGLCTYDLRVRSTAVIDAARATHPSVTTGGVRSRSVDYRTPSDFLENVLAAAPEPPDARPNVSTTILGLDELGRVRELVRSCAAADSAVPPGSIDDLVSAVNEVAANGVVHGAPPVDITLWAGLSAVTCLVEDSGPGLADLLAGYRYPAVTGPMGLWATRQLCRDVVVAPRAGGGTSVLLIAS